MAASTQSEFDVYMSGALTGLDEATYAWATREVYDRVLETCQSIGLSCYCPHRSETTPTRGITHSKVWKIDYRNVVNTGAVVAYIGIPSLGVGAEIEMARSASVPVILVCDFERQEGISRLILGNPAATDCIIFRRPEDMEEELKRALYLIFSEKTLKEVAEEEDLSFVEYSRLRSTLEQEAGADKFRHPSFTPIGKEEWIEMKRRLEGSQRRLLDD